MDSQDVFDGVLFDPELFDGALFDPELFGGVGGLFDNVLWDDSLFTVDVGLRLYYSVYRKYSIESDAFDGIAGQTLQNYDERWIKHPSYSPNMVITASGRTQAETTGSVATAYYYNVQPSSANYSVSSTLHNSATVDGASSDSGVIGRCNPTQNTLYMFRYLSSSGHWQLWRAVNGNFTTLSSKYQFFGVAGSTRHIRMEMIDNVVNCYLDGSDVPFISHTDSSPITAPGFAGIRVIGRSHPFRLQLDNFEFTTTNLTIAPTGPQIVSGPQWEHAVATGNALARTDTGLQTFPEVVGLMNGGQYRVAFVLFDGTLYSPVVLDGIPLIQRRSIIMMGHYLSEISNAMIGTGLKPMVLFNGSLQQRANLEGLPVTLDNGMLRTLEDGEGLII